MVFWKKWTWKMVPQINYIRAHHLGTLFAVLDSLYSLPLELRMAVLIARIILSKKKLQSWEISRKFEKAKIPTMSPSNIAPRHQTVFKFLSALRQYVFCTKNVGNFSFSINFFNSVDKSTTNTEIEPPLITTWKSWKWTLPGWKLIRTKKFDGKRNQNFSNAAVKTEINAEESELLSVSLLEGKRKEYMVRENSEVSSFPT